MKWSNKRQNNQSSEYRSIFNFNQNEFSQNKIVLIFVLIDWLKIRKLSVYINVNFKREENFFKLQQHVIDEKRNDDQFMHLSIVQQKRIQRQRFLKLFQNVKSRWNFTCHMLIKVHFFRSKIDQFCQKWNVEYLLFDDDEWSQIMYLIQLLKSFCVYIKMLSTIRKFTIQSIFRIYNRLFDHLKRNKTQFYRKEIFWKKNLIDALKTAETKLNKYYNQTQNELELLYDKITLLHFTVEDALFNSSKWKIKSR